MASSRDAMRGPAALVGDEQFGATFRDNTRYASVAVTDPLDWANRVIELPGGHWCVTGVRFRGLDVNRPFVDVVATSLPPRADALAMLSAVVVAQYSAFKPHAIRVNAPSPDELVAALRADARVAGAAVDQYIVAGLVRELRERPQVPRYAEVQLRPMPPNAAAESIATMYARLQESLPDLSEWATPSSIEELKECAAEQLLFQVSIDTEPAGVIAAHREDDHGMTGFVVQDIVVDQDHRGRRLAPAIHQRLLSQLPAQDGDVLWGTIHPDNLPSLASAHAIGREVIAGYAWVTPRDLPGH